MKVIHRHMETRYFVSEFQNKNNFKKEPLFSTCLPWARGSLSKGPGAGKQGYPHPSVKYTEEPRKWEEHTGALGIS